MPTRIQNSNKGTFGKVLNIVSSEKYLGAGYLAALSSLRVGAGLSLFCSCDEAINRIQFSPDLIYKSHKNFDFEIVKNIIETENISAVVLGCGISTEDNVVNFTKYLLEFLKTKNIPVVVDADGLNCVSYMDNIILNHNFILTPHPKELSRLIKFGVEEIESNREYFVSYASEKFNATVVLKGHQTLISGSNSRIYENRTGNSVLAKGGSGDVLAGMIGGFLAQKVMPTDACILSVYLHGMAGEIYSVEFNEYSMLPNELMNYIPYAINSLCH